MIFLATSSMKTMDQPIDSKWFLSKVVVADSSEIDPLVKYFRPAWKFAAPQLFPWLNMDLLATLLNDPDDRIEPEFQISPSLKEPVLFWLRVYARYDSNIRVIHDRYDLRIVYGIIDLTPILVRYTDTARAESVASSVERAVVEYVRNLLLSHKTRMNDRASSDSHYLESYLYSLGYDRTSFHRMAQSIRTQTGQKNHFISALHRSTILLPHIESVFAKQGLPLALARVPFVESSFNARALSRIGAMGLWQFVPETARELIHPEREDEWTDPLKQTQSAAVLFKRYRAVLPDWGSTITAYNSGVGRVQRLIRNYRLRNFDALLRLRENDGLGFAGRNFYAEFLAATIAESYREQIFDEIELRRGTSEAASIPKEVCHIY